MDVCGFGVDFILIGGRELGIHVDLIRIMLPFEGVVMVVIVDTVALIVFDDSD